MKDEHAPRGDGIKWLGQDRAGKDRWGIWIHLGHNKQKTKRIRGTRREAERERRELLRALEHNELSQAPARLTVGEYLTGTWLPHEQARVGPKTYEREEEIVRTQIIPALGHLRLTKLGTADLDDFYTNARRRTAVVNCPHKPCATFTGSSSRRCAEQ